MPRMLFRQILHRDLGCASYLLADSGEALVVDPRWDIDVYLELAATERLRIAHVLDTHDHADHVSGRSRLAKAARAQPYPPGALAPGDALTVGSLRIAALSTPGHRPEHVSFVVADLSRGSEPWLVLSGDSLLVGDVARPDLAVDAVDGARALHGSLRGLLDLGDEVEIWPAHVGGSLCGGAGLSGKTSSTLGFERRHNALLSLDEPAFVAGLTAVLPARPPNIARIVELNRTEGGTEPAAPRTLDAHAIANAVAGGATVIDGRAPEEFDVAHIAGALNLPVMAKGVGTRAGWALDPQSAIVVVAETASEALSMVGLLHAVGFWQIDGHAVADPDSWRANEIPVATAGAWTIEQLADRLIADKAALIDVREGDEWEQGHVLGSRHVPLSRVRALDSATDVDGSHTVAVACAGGTRAAFAASLLRRSGRTDVVRVEGGGIADLGELGLTLAVGP